MSFVIPPHEVAAVAHIISLLYVQRDYTMTRQEFYEKYKDVEFTLNGYNKYVFTFVGDYNGQTVYVGVGGNSDSIYHH